MGWPAFRDFGRLPQFLSRSRSWESPTSTMYIVSTMENRACQNSLTMDPSHKDNIDCQIDENPKPLHDHGVDRAREILGSLKVRREELLQTLRSSRPNDASEDSAASSKASLESIASSRSRTLVYHGKATDMLTAQMSKILQERRDRLSRILAGLDPDGRDDSRESSPIESDDSRLNETNSLKALEGSGPEPAVPKDSPLNMEIRSGNYCMSKPPTLEEIREAFKPESIDETCSSTGAESHGCNGDDAEPITNAGVAPQPCRYDVDATATEYHVDQPIRVEQETGSPNSCQFSDSDLSPASLVDGATMLPSPRCFGGVKTSPFRRAYSFEDTVTSPKEDPSIRMTFSFNSLFLESPPRLRFKPRPISVQGVATPPPNDLPLMPTSVPCASNSGLKGSNGSPNGQQDPSASCSCDGSLAQPASELGNCETCTVELDIVSQVDSETLSPPAIFSPGEERNILPPRPSAKVPMVFLSDQPVSPASASSTLSSKGDRATNWRFFREALDVKRPVPCYPQEHANADSDALHNTNEVNSSSSDEKKVAWSDVATADRVTIVGGSVASNGNPGLSLSRTLSDDQSHAISDASSFDCTLDDTMTSGYLSIGASERLNSLLGDEITEVSTLLQNASYEMLDEDMDSFDMLLPPPNQLKDTDKTKDRDTTSRTTRLESCLVAHSERSADKQVAAKKVAFMDPDATPREPGSSVDKLELPVAKKPPLYFVAEDIADSLCFASGSLYALAVASGLDLMSPLDMIRIKPCTGSSGTKHAMRLNPDFRCGARGSTYDIFIQSGFNLNEPWEWRKKRKFMPVKGGLFDLALRSGLTKELLHSRGPLTIKTKPLSLCRKDDSEVLPEDVSDYECGANGNLYLAFESAGGDYVSKGSLYYLATQSGMKLSQ